MLKSTAKTLCTPLCIIFNRSLQEGVFPDVWKTANVIPIFKKGEADTPSNYRPVWGKFLNELYISISTTTCNSTNSFSKIKVDSEVSILLYTNLLKYIIKSVKH
jgi:hypothetical protein